MVWPGKPLGGLGSLVRGHEVVKVPGETSRLVRKDHLWLPGLREAAVRGTKQCCAEKEVLMLDQTLGTCTRTGRSSGRVSLGAVSFSYPLSGLHVN